jgi:hypothetical protein
MNAAIIGKERNKKILLNYKKEVRKCQKRKRLNVVNVEKRLCYLMN